MNWRKPIITGLLSLTRDHTLSHLRTMLAMEYRPPAEIASYQTDCLRQIIIHAYHNVPYYSHVLKDAGVILSNDKIDLSRYSYLPVLTKDIIKNEFANLQSRDSANRHPYPNSSGGSSGTPLKITQDRAYHEWNVANSIYYKTFAKQAIGQSELRLWGSERDLEIGHEKISTRLRNWLYHRREINAFRMTPTDMVKYAADWNCFRPRWIESYVDAMYEFANFFEVNHISMHTPVGILTSAGTLYPFMKEKIEQVFGCPVINRYGSREVGGIACSCPGGQGLHLSAWNSFVEILNDDLRPIAAGQMGRVYVTTLHNYSMPLLRYDIGDLAEYALSGCTCGRGTPLLAKVHGREMTVFRTRDKTIVPAEFFIHYIGVVFNQGSINKFQVVQKDYDQICINVVTKNQASVTALAPDVEHTIRRAMGSDCKVDWNFVDDIPRLSSGKYLYVVSELKPPDQTTKSN
ncbi:MAG: phenylacetate--CoA ligase family protein [Patescibacteria group bacterium]|jgi:phenylacetate-CoA ligase